MGQAETVLGWIYLRQLHIVRLVLTTSGSSSKPAASKSNVPYRVRIDATDLRIRSGAGTNYPKTGAYTGKGVFTIIEEKQEPVLLRAGVN